MTRSPYWSPGDELRHDAEALTLATSLFPDRANENPFFTEGPRRIFAHLLTFRPTAEELASWLCHDEELDCGRTSAFDAGERRHLDYGYAVTSHSSQGQTAGRVLVHVESERAAEKLVNKRLAYVAVSRGQYDARIYTDDKVKLARALDRDVSHRSALERTPGHASRSSESRELARRESIGHAMAVGST